GLAVDRAVVDVAVVHLARFFGEFLSDIVGVLGEVLAQLLELCAELALLRGHEGDRRLGFAASLCRRLASRSGRLGRRRSGMATLLSAGETRAHDRLLDFDVAADRAAHQAARPLLVVSRGILKPAFEGVSLGAGKRVANHRSPPAAWSGVGSAIGWTISKRRPCCSEGMRPRALTTSAGSMLAITTPGSVPPSARIPPQGSTTSE